MIFVVGGSMRLSRCSAHRPSGSWALRHQAWTAGPDLYRVGSLPGDAAVEQESQTVVAEVPETVRGSPDLFDLKVDCLGRAIRCPCGVEVGEELHPPGAQR